MKLNYGQFFILGKKKWKRRTIFHIQDALAFFLLLFFLHENVSEPQKESKGKSA